MTIEVGTLLFLVIVFVGAEIWTHRHGLRGRVIEMVDDANGLPRMVDRQMKVRLNAGSVVTARVSGCTSCMARFVLGDPVVLVRHSGGYTVTVPWFERTCSAPEEGRCHG